MAPTGEPRESPKPQPLGNTTVVFLFTTCTLCLIFLLWRRSDALKRVVSHQLKTFTESAGRIRLSEDDGLPARAFLENDDTDDDDDTIVNTADGVSPDIVLRPGEVARGNAPSPPLPLPPK